jgi:hypothetical protein
VTWEEAESLVARLVEGELVTDKAAQLQDIDVRSDGKTYSVKCQKAAAKYHNASFEVELLDEEGNSILGNFARCAADYCCIVIPWPDSVEVLCFDTKGLKWFLQKNQYPVKGLTLAAQATNDGRRYKFARNIIVPLKDLRPIADWRVVETPSA